MHECIIYPQMKSCVNKKKLTSLGLPEMPNLAEDLFRLFKSMEKKVTKKH